MGFGGFLWSVLIFVVGSFILTWIVSPQSLSPLTDKISSVGNTISNMADSKSLQQPKTIEIIPSEMEEYGFWKDSYKSCAGVETLGESNGVTGIKGKVCTEACGKKDKEYYSYDCRKDKLYCNCLI